LANSQAGEGWQQGWVYVHYPAGKLPEKCGGKNSHESCQDNQVYLIAFKDFYQFLIKVFPVRVLGMRYYFGRYAFYVRTLKGINTREIANDDADLTVNILVLTSVHYGLEIASAARDQDANANHVFTSMRG
jgi:hypothetical protein